MKLPAALALAGAALLPCSLSAAAGPARATLDVLPGDATVAVRVPKATATLSVVPAGGAAVEVPAGDDGYARFSASLAAGGGAVLFAGEPFLELRSASSPPALPDLLPSGDVALAVPVPAGADPAGCALTLENEAASIRQDFAGADVFISGAAPRCVFLGHVAPDQAGANAATLTTSAGVSRWRARVYHWTWAAARPSVARGEEARFALVVTGLETGADCETVLQAPEGLVLREAPGAIESLGGGRWRVRGGAGEYVFRVEAGVGDQVVTADLAPCPARK